jgi:hypothetical protein
MDEFDPRVERFRIECNKHIEPTLNGMSEIVRYQQWLYALPEGLEVQDLPTYEDFLKLKQGGK